mmetsp:Transcript_62051/g.146309  ORF Transcript_62051/g.146309 Transcript_62051/m.146309 type:complete len:346 (+) Transcript_62051:95-1132(+)
MIMYRRPFVLVLAAVSCVAVANCFQVNGGAALKSGSGRNCAATNTKLSMQVGGGGLKGLGGDKDAYYERLRERKEALARGEGVNSAPTSDALAMVSENEEVLFDMLNSDMSEEEVSRLAAANKARMGLDVGEEDPELEKALLAMFVEQGDVSPDALMEKKAEEAAKKTVIELDQPLDLETSRELFKAMNKYESMEQGVWDEVQQEMQSGTIEVPDKVKEHFFLKKEAAAPAAAGVEVTTSKPGDGKTYPQSGDLLTMHYKGTLASDGSKFDSSYDRDTPFSFMIGVGQVIKGWDEGVMQMSLGEKATLRIAPEFGYGARGFPPVIPPNSELVFEVELLRINGVAA